MSLNILHIVCFAGLVLCAYANTFSPSYLSCATLISFDAKSSGDDEWMLKGWFSILESGSYGVKPIVQTYIFDPSSKNETYYLYTPSIQYSPDSRSVIIKATTDKEKNDYCSLWEVESPFVKVMLFPYANYFYESFDYSSDNESDIWNGVACHSYTSQDSTETKTIYALDRTVIGLKIETEGHVEEASFSVDRSLPMSSLFMNPKYLIGDCLKYEEAFYQPDILSYNCHGSVHFSSFNATDLPCLYKVNMNKTIEVNSIVYTINGWEARYGRTRAAFYDHYNYHDDNYGSEAFCFVEVGIEPNCILYTGVKSGDSFVCMRNGDTIDNIYLRFETFKYFERELEYSFKNEDEWNGVKCISYFLKDSFYHDESTTVYVKDGYVIGILKTDYRTDPDRPQISRYILSYDMEPTTKCFTMAEENICNESSGIPYPNEPNCPLTPVFDNACISFISVSFVVLMVLISVFSSLF